MSLFPSTIHQAAQAAATLPVAAPLPVPGLNTTMFDLSSALTTTNVVAPPGMVRPYQAHQAAGHVAANAAIATFGTAVIGDDMGLGKTQLAEGLIAEYLHAAQGGYAVVIAPPVTWAGWSNDLAAAFPGLRMAQLKGRTPDFANLPIADVYWLSDDSTTMQKWLTNKVTTTDKHGKEHVEFQANAFSLGAKVLVRDEIHRDKGSNGKATTGRAKVMMALGKAFQAQGTPIIGMTGTLLTNRVVEAFVPLQYLGGERLIKALTPGAKTVTGFLWEYANPQEKWARGRKFYVYGTNLAKAHQLHTNLRSTVYVRREKSDLGDALPNSGWLVKPIALNGVLRRYNQLANEFLATVLAEEGPKAYLAKSKVEAAQRMMALWQEAGNAKVGATVDYVETLTDQGRKVVVFYHHTRNWENLGLGLTDRGIKWASINGKVTGARREGTINDFQAPDGDTMVILAQLGAAGVGVTLTAAADAVFAQIPWSAGDLKQAADRILRTDQISRDRAARGEAVTWHVLQAAQADGSPTFDMTMFEVVQRKAQLTDAVNAGRPVTIDEDSVWEEALEVWFPQAQAQYN